METKGYKPIKILGYLCTLFLIPIGVVRTTTLMMSCAIIIPFIIFLTLAITVFSKLKYNVADASVTILGALYTVLMVAFLSATRAMPMGVFLLFYAICGAWFSDIFAYLIGRKIGKHKFSTISPKKSIEGCIAGVFGTIIFFVLYSTWLGNLNFKEFKETSNSISSIVQLEEKQDNPLKSVATDVKNTNPLATDTKIVVDDILENITVSDEFNMQQTLKEEFFFNYPLLIVLGIIVSVVSQIGDFAASGIKRYADIKDFSNLMPGHGGMLDRFDSVLFVTPIIYYTFFIIVNT